MPPTARDETIAAYFALLDQYTVEHRALCELLGQGQWALAESKYAMGPGCPSQWQYDQRMKASRLVESTPLSDGHIDLGDTEACTLALVRVDPATYWLNDELTASAEKSLEDSARLASQTLRQRRPQTATEQPDSLPTSPTPNPETTDPKPIPMAVDPLRWFGLLTPASLQRGQQLFVRALDCGIRVANLRRQLDAAYTLISQSSEGDATLPEASKP